MPAFACQSYFQSIVIVIFRYCTKPHSWLLDGLSSSRYNLFPILHKAWYR